MTSFVDFTKKYKQLLYTSLKIRKVLQWIWKNFKKSLPREQNWFDQILPLSYSPECANTFLCLKLLKTLQNLVGFALYIKKYKSGKHILCVRSLAWILLNKLIIPYLQRKYSVFQQIFYFTTFTIRCSVFWQIFYRIN